MQAVTIEDLKNVVAFSGLPDEHLQWILDRSEYQEHEDGSLLVTYGDPAEVMWILLEGRVNFYMNVNGKQVYYFTFDNDNTSGGVGGLLPYSRMKSSPGYAYANGRVRYLRLNKKYFQELELLNPSLIQRLIGYMTERARAFATTKLQHEKVNALGSLAAGIAHELNNPAAAINSISNELAGRLNRNFELTEKLLHGDLNPEQIHSIRLIVEQKENDPAHKSKRTVIQRMQNEDELEEWLEKNKLDGQREIAETFSEAGFTAAELEDICRNAGADEFISLLLWLENLLSSQKIIKDLGEASARISNLVGAIKSHVHMDRTGDLQTTDIHKDIEDTLTLLGYKLREKNITVKKRLCADMPVVPAYVGELNQVWTNIIDNAIYAMPKNGELTIETSLENDFIKVCLIDNGTGIPQDIISRIFDPFFTTKKIGEGTGIGLDTVNQIIKHHNGEIKVSSVPGRTAFTVCIPASEKRTETIKE